MNCHRIKAVDDPACGMAGFKSRLRHAGWLAGAFALVAMGAVAENRFGAEIIHLTQPLLFGNPHDLEFRFLIDGAEKSVQTKIIIERGADGTMLYASGTIQDITERKKIEAELDRHREHLEELVQHRTLELAETNERLCEAIIRAEQANEAKASFLVNMSHVSGRVAAGAGAEARRADTAEPINWTALYERFDGREPSIRKLLASMLKSHQETAEQIRQAVIRNDGEALRFLAHSLKSTAGNLEVSSLYELSKQVAFGLKENDSTAIARGHDLAAALAETIAAIEEKLAAMDNAYNRDIHIKLSGIWPLIDNDPFLSSDV
jgi:HPt (histidine-containing phosphotransfer) domain-containing protein